MRNITTWYKNLSQTIQASVGDDIQDFSAKQFCQIELGLTASCLLTPDEDVKTLWVLLAGYPFEAINRQKWTPVQVKIRAVARHLLPFFRGPYAWDEAITWYQQLPADIRGYDIAEGLANPRNVSTAPHRFDVYEQVLSEAPELTKRRLDWADAGDYAFRNGRRYQDVTISPEWVLPALQGHDLHPKLPRKSLKVSWDNLRDTAEEMDNHLPEHKYLSRFDRMHLDLMKDGKLTPTELLEINGLLHLAGMVSSGKSTLMQILTVWAARNGLHVTVVLGDVVAILEWVAIFEAVGLDAAPIIGAYNRTQHLNRLHRIESQKNPGTPLNIKHAGFQWLGNVCAINGYADRPGIMDTRDFPCTSLEKADNLDEGKTKFHACPVYSACGVHEVQRRLPEAQVWVATPASLIYTRIATQVNQESLRFGEVVSRHSDLVLVDEADRVQTQLDQAFSPSEILAGSGGEPWLNQISRAVEELIRRRGRDTLRTREVEAWMSVQRSTQTATDKLYALLLQRQKDLLQLQQDYFTGWTVWEALVSEILGIQDVKAINKQDNPVYEHLMEAFNEFVRQPFATQSQDEYRLIDALRDVTRTLLTEPSTITTDAELQDLLRDIFSDIKATDERWKAWTSHFAFALVTSVVSWGVNYLTQHWEQVKVPMELKDNNTALFYNPPQDYDAVIPPAPMGNVLAFQYMKSTDSEQAGILRFFRISGVGRWWLLNLHQLFEAEGIPGPNVMLLSGTSWAGESPLYHIQHPVGGILHAPQTELDAIQNHSRFQYTPVYDEDREEHIYVSGTSHARRYDALRKILTYYTKKTGPTQSDPSRFENERNRLPENRKRLMLLVGSYSEAEAVRIMLEQLRPEWKGQVLNLVRDDDSPADSWVGSEATLQRGQVDRFAETEAWILIAPLLAVERGHNILNENNKAAIGAAYFLIRPHPRPDDLTLPISAINAWAVDNGKKDWGDNILHSGENFRQEAYKRWRKWLHMPWIYSTLPQNERAGVTWTQLITIWQVVGRLIRGGSPARVYFVDAAFKSKRYQPDDDSEDPYVIQIGLLAEMQNVLAPYFDSNSPIEPTERELVKTLYEPFYRALSQIGEV